MKIIHYALGFYPYRTGGLTQYVMDLMSEQQRQGHEVGLLWPGRLHCFRKKIKIIKKRRKNLQYSYELVNPLPVPLLEGVKDIMAYTESGDLEGFRTFLKEEMPDILHIHTFMGLYEELLDAAKDCGIKIVYTTHDYYALCPKVNLLCGEKICQTGMTDQACSSCDMRPLSNKKIWIMQSPFYRYVKDSPMIKKLRKKYILQAHKKNQAKVSQGEKSDKKVYSYHLLREKYENMLKKADIIHCNSSVAEKVYKRFVPDITTKVMSITNHNIVDKRKKRVYNNKEKLRISFLGSASVYKGFFLLVDVLNDIYWMYPEQFVLNLYFPVGKKETYMQIHEPFAEGELDAVLENTDVVVVPSLWMETFGFVALEAISRGVPVIITENVGAKDLVINRYNGMRIHADKGELKDAVIAVLENRKLLSKMNDNICGQSFSFFMEKHAEDLVRYVYVSDKEGDTQKIKSKITR